MTESPLRFQVVTAVLAVGGTLLLVDTEKPPPSGVVTRLRDPVIDESSGLVDTGEHLLTVNDSGGDPVVYLVDKASGRTVGRTRYAEDAVDVEALAPGPGGSVWVGDIGDNGHRRPTVSVYRLPRVVPGDRTVRAERFDLAYRDGPRDAEALLVHPRTGRLHVVSKGLLGGQLLRAPRVLRADRVNVLTPVADTAGLVTDGAFLPDGRHVVLRTYSRADVLAAAGWATVSSFRLPEQRQGEGIAVPATGGEEPDHVLVSSEGDRSRVLAVPLPAAVADAVAEEEPLSARGVVEAVLASPARRTAGVVAVSAAAAALGVLLLRRVRAARRRGRSTR